MLHVLLELECPDLALIVSKAQVMSTNKREAMIGSIETACTI